MKNKDSTEQISVSLNVKGLDIGGASMFWFLGMLAICATSLVIAHWCLFGALGG